MKQLRSRAFLEFVLNQDVWNLTEPYAKVTEEYFCLEPMIFRLPWPTDLIPMVGAEFSSEDLPDEFSGLVKSIEYNHCIHLGIVVEVKIVEKDIHPGRFDDKFLVCLAEAGMCFYPEVPIAKVLREAGLSLSATKALKRN